MNNLSIGILLVALGAFVILAAVFYEFIMGAIKRLLIGILVYAIVLTVLYYAGFILPIEYDLVLLVFVEILFLVVYVMQRRSHSF